MLGEAVIDADVVLTGIAAFNFVSGASRIKSLRFTVEEDEMFVDLKVLLTASHGTVNGLADFTFAHQGPGATVLTDLAPLAAGLFRKTFGTLANAEDVVSFERTVQFAKGEHRIELHAKAPAGNLTVEGATWNGWLTARRHDHPATAAAQTNSKVQGVY